MTRYLNYGGSTDIAAYETGYDYIKVQLRNGELYTFDYGKPGQYHVEQMKFLAKRGVGLDRYIQEKVRSQYAMKSR